MACHCEFAHYCMWAKSADANKLFCIDTSTVRISFWSAFFPHSWCFHSNFSTFSSSINLGVCVCEKENERVWHVAKHFGCYYYRLFSRFRIFVYKIYRIFAMREKFSNSTHKHTQLRLSLGFRCSNRMRRKPLLEPHRLYYEKFHDARSKWNVEVVCCRWECQREI